MLKRELIASKISDTILQHGCLNTMEICRACNGLDPFNYRFCGTPVYTKPFANNGKILEAYRHKTGNGTCWHHSECKIKYKRVFEAVRTVEALQSIKRIAPDNRARIKKSKLKTDLFRFWFIDPQAYEKRLNKDHSLDAWLDQLIF